MSKYKITFLCICLLNVSLQLYAMDNVESHELLKNHFDLISDYCIKQIADNLDNKDRGYLRLSCRRFSKAAWPSMKAFCVAMEKKSSEPEGLYWQKVLSELHQLSERIERLCEHNDIVLSLLRVDDGFTLPEELCCIKNLNGLVMGYNLSGNGPCRREQLSNHNKILMMMPYLKVLSLPFGREERLKFAFNQFKRLQSLAIAGYDLKSKNIALLPKSLTTLELQDCSIRDVPQLEKLPALCSLTIMQIFFYQNVVYPYGTPNRVMRTVIPDALEKLLTPLAHSLEKLTMVCSELITLPGCLALFEKLQELNICANDLRPDALTCLVGLKNLRLLNLTGNNRCESQKDLVRKMLPETVTIVYKDT